MKTQLDESQSARRRSIYALLIVISIAVMTGRILTVESKTVGPDRNRTPFLSANDRSRWCTIRALVDRGTYEIDYLADGTDDNWKTIDKVRHVGHDGRNHYYSSKPPLLPTLLAGQYWLMRQLTGAEIATEPFYVGRSMLVLTNVMPMLLWLVLIAAIAERLGQSDWGRIFVVATASFGTLLTTFAVTLNNHLPAAISVTISIFLALGIWYDDWDRWTWYALTGLCAAFATANELPALSFLVAMGIALLCKSPSKTMVAFVPSAGVVVAAFFLTNYLAHDSWKPAYAHRQDGALRSLLELPRGAFADLDDGRLSAAVRAEIDGIVPSLSSTAKLETRTPGLRWALVDGDQQRRLAFVRKGNRLEIRDWGDWYDYAKSYWLDGKRGVDVGEPSRWVYAFHVLVGHHGLFSLTPVWLLSVAGLWCWFRGPHQRPALATLITGLSIVCFVFYVFLRPEKDRNYGGVSCGFRWMLWLVPLWLLAMIPAADALAGDRRWRAVGLALLALSVLSAAAAGMNPWTHPWLFRYWQEIGWIMY